MREQGAVERKQLVRRGRTPPEEGPAELRGRVDLQQQLGKLDLADPAEDGLADPPRFGFVALGRQRRHVQQAVRADADPAAPHGASQLRQACRDARQQRADERLRAVGQAEELQVPVARRNPLARGQQHRLAGAV